MHLNMGKVLILGAGLVARPMVDYFIANGFQFVIASPTKGRADEMINGNPLGASVDWSMDDPETLEMLIAGNDVIVSLLPYTYHTDVARICIRQRKPLVTTSYIQNEMQGFDEAAKNAGILFLNEAGLDPGLDHMSAMKIIDLIHNNGGKVEEFYSFCGALPAPEAASNPLKYKFSWSPRGVVLASLNSAMYLKDRREVFTGSKDIFKDIFTFNFPQVGDLDVYPNRDSMSYINIYGIPEAKTIYRGTFRYKGWCETLDAMKSLNMLDDAIRDYNGFGYIDFLAERAGLPVTDLKKNIAARLGVTEESPAISSLEYLGFFSDEKMKYYETNPFEITSDRMIGRMMLGDNERDMVALQHIFLALWGNGRKEVIKSSMLSYGTPSENTAIARTVALPASVAVKLILENRIRATGVLRPVLPEIYNPILEELKRYGIEMKEEYNLPENQINLFV